MGKMLTMLRRTSKEHKKRSTNPAGTTNLRKIDIFARQLMGKENLRLRIPGLLQLKVSSDLFS